MITNRNLKRTLAVLLALGLCGGSIFAKEYKIFYSGGIEGVVTVSQDAKGKITITPQLTQPYGYENSLPAVDFTQDLCTFIPKGKGLTIFDFVSSYYFSLFTFTKDVIIDGNTAVITDSKGEWEKYVIEGNTALYTTSSDYSSKTTIEGNVKTVTSNQGSTLVYDRNNPYPGLEIIVEGNTTIHKSRSVLGQANISIVNKKGSDFYITVHNETTLGKSGKAYADQGDYDRAIADFKTLLRIAPNNEYASKMLIYVYITRGNAYYGQKDYTRAIADYEAALRINPNHTNAQNNLGNARRARGY